MLIKELDNLISRKIDKLTDDSREMGDRKVKENIYKVLYDNIDNVYNKFLQYDADEEFIETYDII